MTLSTQEIDSLRFHLGYGSVGVTALPYTPDGFWAIFEQVISPNLSTGTEDSSTTAVTAGAVTTITISDATEFAVYGEAVIDVGDNAEVVVVQAKTSTTLVAYFAKTHAASGYPVATISGKARLRLALHEANKGWRAMQDSAVGAVSGIKQLDKGDVVFFEGKTVLRGKLDHYRAIVEEISRIVRVAPVWSWSTRSSGSVQLEAY